MLVIAVEHGCCSWVEVFNVSPALAACILFSGGMRTRLQEKGFQARPARLTRVLCPKCAMLQQLGPPSTPERQPRAASIVYVVYRVTRVH